MKEPRNEANMHCVIPALQNLQYPHIYTVHVIPSHTVLCLLRMMYTLVPPIAPSAPELLAASLNCRSTLDTITVTWAVSFQYT